MKLPSIPYETLRKHWLSGILLLQKIVFESGTLYHTSTKRLKSLKWEIQDKWGL